MQPVTIERGYTVEVPVSVYFNASERVLESRIRVNEDVDSDVIAEWEITFVTDGTDGELLFRIPSSVTEVIELDEGYMFLRDFTGDDPIDIFDNPLFVVFIDV